MTVELAVTDSVAEGLVSRAVPADQLLDTLRAAARAARGPTRAFARSRALVRRIGGERLGLAQGAALEAEAQRLASATVGYREGVTAFVEQRSPGFVGR